MSNIENRLTKLEKHAKPATDESLRLLFLDENGTEAECLVRHGYKADDTERTIFVNFLDAAI